SETTVFNSVNSSIVGSICATNEATVERANDSFLLTLKNFNSISFFTMPPPKIIKRPLHFLRCGQLSPNRTSKTTDRYNHVHRRRRTPLPWSSLPCSGLISHRYPNCP